ncbi:hypothetical protein B7494_g2302 [Chlorociboria aeruginascens]|nr:hypothetical protein B7494_g2302 [Chlorociboria aeruginascens]
MAQTSSSNPLPIITSRSSSLEKVPQLVGQLNSDGIANLEVDGPHASTNNGPSRYLKASLETNIDYTKGHPINTSSESTSEEEEEDYDSLRHDPRTIVDGGKGGGYSGKRSSTSNPSYEELKTPKSLPKPNSSRLKSIPVTLNKLEENGRYVLTADDDTLRELLKISVEREKNPSAKRRSKFSDLVFTRRFTAFDSQNSESAGSPFRGFFNLFWLGTAIFMIRIAAENWRQHGSILGTNEIMSLMFHRDVMVLGLSDGVMCAATGFSLTLQKFIFKGVIRWNKEGWIIQSIWEALFLVVGLAWTLIREWPWSHTVFFVLHCLVMLMKQHSYAFYNGHLSEGYKTREALRLKLKQLDRLAPSQSPSATSPSVSSLSTSYLEHRPTASDLNRRRQSLRSGSCESGAANMSQVASAIESGEPLDLDQIQTFERIIKWEVDALTEDLKGKSTITGNFYPKNLTVANHYEYIVLPTLVYELEYPRMDHINWFYVAEKTVAVFGILIIMNMVSQAFIYPQVMLANQMKEDGMTLLERLKVFPWILSDLMFPFMMEYMMASNPQPLEVA